jgi:hypothetical protein
MFTNCVKRSPTSANSHSVTQETSQLLWEEEFHYRFYKSPKLVLKMSQMNPVHIFLPCFLKNIYFKFNIFLCLRQCLTSSISESKEVE